MSLGKDFAVMMARDLDLFVRQIEAFPDEESLWITAGSIKNSAGTLALHVAGNLEHFVGAALGNTGYVRDRDAEFGARDVPRADLVQALATCKERITATLEGLDDDTVLGAYPAALPPVPGLERGTTHVFLLHLTGHVQWHLGQVDYLRRILVEGSSER